MKLLELEITNTRGIRHLILSPNGKNLVVWGPNGSGKSGVVDALDFLLTGRITRLTGKGTGNISLSKHGPHIDFGPDDAIVRAVIQISGIKDPIEIRRCIAHPSVLECENESAKTFLDQLTALAHNGQHVLTRREILKYITADGSTRAEQIQELLNISEIEDVRRSLVATQTELMKEFRATSRNLEIANGVVGNTIQNSTPTPDLVLDVVNQNRAILNAQPISVLLATQLKTKISLPTTTSNQRPVSVTLLDGDIKNLKSVANQDLQVEISSYDEQLRSTITFVNSDPSLLEAYSRQQLVQLGLGLISDTGACPLCDTSWEKGALQDYLTKKLSSAQAVGQYLEKIDAVSKSFRIRIGSIFASLQTAIAAAKVVNLREDEILLKSWQDDLQILLKAIDPYEKTYLSLSFESNLICKLLSPDNITDVVDRILSTVKEKYPETTPEQTAWDTLTRLEENLKALERAIADHEAAQISLKRASILVESFEGSRNQVLTEIYDSIKDRFVNLYQELHKADEGNFDALLEPDGAALNLEVGFYGRGNHPPQALHSEGHQDSMGLCLYLALAERLTKGLIDLIILDDVVMSVDADHRRDLCRLLATEFPNRQFLITTHDKTWATQLKTEGVVSSKDGTVEFYNWRVETGPQINADADMWAKIEEDLRKNDVQGAATKLRRASEEFFATVCDSLQAPVRYRLNGRWDLGDFLPSSMGKYRQHLKHARQAYQSWDDQEAVRMLNELESTSGQIFSRTNAEQWAVNASVHYNNWANLSIEDFRPVVEAFQDLYALFVCSNCGGILFVATVGLTPTNLRCSCGKVNWNLQSKP